MGRQGKSLIDQAKGLELQFFHQPFKIEVLLKKGFDLFVFVFVEDLDFCVLHSHLDEVLGLGGVLVDVQSWDMSEFSRALRLSS
jgi:hypothetical protein